MKVVNVLIGIVIVAILFALAFPILFSGRIVDRASACMSNIKQSMLAQLMYAGDHDERLPPSLTWMDATQKYVKDADIFTCPERKKMKEGDYGHAMNVELSLASTDFKNPQDIPVLFDSVLLARNACSGFYGFPDPEEKKTAVAYLDYHARFLKTER